MNNMYLQLFALGSNMNPNFNFIHSIQPIDIQC